jgi:hypothetical protein
MSFSSFACLWDRTRSVAAKRYNPKNVFKKPKQNAKCPPADCILRAELMSMRYSVLSSTCNFCLRNCNKDVGQSPGPPPNSYEHQKRAIVRSSVFDSRGYARSNRYSDIDMETDAQVVVSKDENDTTCIAFRGTSSIVDWDEQPPLVGPSQLDPQAMVHAGFFRRLGICQERSLHRDR